MPIQTPKPLNKLAAIFLALAMSLGASVGFAQIVSHDNSAGPVTNVQHVIR